MNKSTASRQRLFGSLAMTAIVMLLALASFLGTPADAVHAQRKKPTPTPAVLAVPAPQVIQVVAAEGNRVIVAVDLGSGYTPEGEYVSGPLQPGGDIVGPARPQALFVDGGYTWLTNLVPNSDYVFRFRRIWLFNSATNTIQAVTSPYITFSFHTPTLEQSRPSAPVISLGEVTATSITVNWNPSTDNVSPTTEISYVYSLTPDPLYGQPLRPTCSIYCFGATGLRINRPAPGTKLVVFAFDSARNQSLPSNELIIP